MQNLKRNFVFILLLAHVHIIKAVVVLVFVVLAFEKVRIKLTKAPVEVDSEHLRVAAAEYFLGEIDGLGENILPSCTEDIIDVERNRSLFVFQKLIS